MPKRLVVFEPSGLRVAADASFTILDAAREVGLHITNECGGRGTCGKCHVFVEPAGRPTRQDIEKIPVTELGKGARLACRHKTSRAIRVILPQRAEEAKILTEGVAGHWELDSSLNGQFGIAIDLGTTTIAAFLLDLSDGVQLARAASLNPQNVFGDDIMSRITHVMREENGAKVLQRRVVNELNQLATQLIQAAGVDAAEVTRVAVVGNTAMGHLLLGTDVTSLGLSPYAPKIYNAVTQRARSIDLHIGESTELYVAPNIAGFVGGDTVAFILSQQLDSTDDVTIGIDIGTNGEIVLSNHGELVCCSAAAGSAFEGASIHHGMRGQTGAIEHVIIHDANSQAEVTVIGDVAPQGLCGSAIVDVVAEMKQAGLINTTGRILEGSPMVESNEKLGLFYRVWKSDEPKQRKRIIFTQKDVRQVQLAKAAIQAGTRLLLEEIGLGVPDIDRVLLAGAFGNYISPKSALTIGLLPRVDISQIIPVGNAAGEGAKGLLLSLESRAKAERIARDTRHVDLAAHEDFQSVFLDSIALV